MARYIPAGISPPSLLVEHEFLPVSFLQRAKFERNPARKIILSARALKKIPECLKWYRRFDRIVVFSPADRDFLRKFFYISRAVVIPLGIDLNAYPLQDKGERCQDLIFAGNFSHYPNVDAALYFHREILPLIRAKFANTSVLFAGAGPPESIKRLAIADKNITVSGYVPDIAACYAKSKICVAPLRQGTGMCFKVLEALALRVPVVATSVGARGIELKKYIELADKPVEFANKVIGLLENPDKCVAMAGQARRLVEDAHSWEKLLDKYEDVYHSLLS
jgi:glycosyltransferase involved in cell wall biosynthesis